MPNPFDDLMKKYRKPPAETRINPSTLENLDYAAQHPVLSFLSNWMKEAGGEAERSNPLKLYRALANLGGRAIGINAPYPNASFAAPGVAGGTPIAQPPVAPPVSPIVNPAVRQYPVDPYEGRTPGPISTNIPGGVKEIPFAKDVLRGQYAGQAITSPGYVAPREGGVMGSTPAGRAGLDRLLEARKEYWTKTVALQGKQNQKTQDDMTLFLAKTAQYSGDSGLKKRAREIMAERNAPIEAKQRKEEIEAKTKAALSMVEAEEGIKAKYRPQQAIGKTLTPEEAMTSASLSTRANEAAETVDLVKGGDANTAKFFDAALADPNSKKYIQDALNFQIHPRVIQLNTDKWKYLLDRQEKAKGDPAKSEQINKERIALAYEMLTESQKYKNVL